MMEAKNAVKQNRLHLRTNTGPTSRLLLFFGLASTVFMVNPTNNKVANLAKIEIEAYLSRAQTQLTEAEQLPALTDGGLE